DAIGLAAEFLEKAGNLLVRRDVARPERRLLAKLLDQLGHVILQPFALVVEVKLGARRRPRLGDRPRDTALVRDAENDADLSCQYLVRHSGQHTQHPSTANSAPRPPTEFYPKGGRSFQSPAPVASI